MPSQEEIYLKYAAEYEALVAREDYQGNVLKAIQELTPLPGLEVLDLGAGTGRLAGLLAPLVRSVLAFDLSSHMLGIAREKLQDLGLNNWLAAAADHRSIPLAADSADLIVCGWSVSYLAVWNPEGWREKVERWLAEARRVLRPGGHILLFESLGTGNESPVHLAHLENFYDWLDEKRFGNKWIRTDYRFESPQEAGEVAGFFFGEETRARIKSEQLTVLPECTGVWWLSV